MLDKKLRYYGADDGGKSLNSGIAIDNFLIAGYNGPVTSIVSWSFATDVTPAGWLSTHNPDGAGFVYGAYYNLSSDPQQGGTYIISPPPSGQDYIWCDNDEGAELNGSNDASNDFLYMPAVTITSGADYVFLQYSYFYTGMFQLKTNLSLSTDGNTWTSVEQLHEDDNATYWRTFTMDVTSYAGQSLHVRWFVDDGGGWTSGMSIDNPTIFAVYKNSVITTGTTTGITTALTTGITTALTTGITTGITTALTTGVTTALTTGITSGITTGVTTALTTGITTGITSGITTGITSGVTTGTFSTGLTTSIMTTSKVTTHASTTNHLGSTTTPRATTFARVTTIHLSTNNNESGSSVVSVSFILLFVCILNTILFS